jgi:hypothetical protein
VHGITFTEPDLLVTYFMARGAGGVLSRRDDPQPSGPYHLTAVFFDAFEGKHRSTLQWSTEPLLAEGIYPAGGGRFLVRTADSLDLYSTAMEHEIHLPLPFVTSAKHQDWEQYLSPDEETLLLLHTVDSQRTFTLLRTQDLSQLSTWNGPSNGVSVYDKSVAWVANFQKVLTRTPDGADRIIYYSPRIICSVPTFVSRDVLVLREQTDGKCRTLDVITLEGKQILTQDFKGEQLGLATLNSIKSASNGEFFAISTETVRGSSFNTLEHLTRLRLRVYSITLHAWVLVEDVEPLPKLFYDFALSPDGRLLAVLSDTTVSVYQVPGTGPD